MNYYVGKHRRVTWTSDIVRMHNGHLYVGKHRKAATQMAAQK